MELSVLKKLCEEYGASGNEERVRKIIINEVKDHCDEVKIDNIGNLICKIGSGHPIYMFEAHMDEIGFVVKYIDENGFIYFVPVGGFWPPTVINQRVVILGDKEVTGVIGSKPPHIMDEEEMKRPLKLKEFFIDVGANSRDEVEKMGIHIGDSIVWKSTFEDIGKNIVSKSLDNRIGVFTLIEMIKQLKYVGNLKGTFYFVFAVQEEVGLKGARIAAFRIQPDVAISVDTGLAGGSPAVQEKEAPPKLGKGPIVNYVEAGGRGLIASPQVNKWLIDVAKANNIPYQVDATDGGVTDAAIIYITGKGIPSASIGIPSRYIHSPNEMINKTDVENTIKLLMKSIETGIKTY